MMTKEIKNKMIYLKNKGYGYARIAEELCLTKTAVAKFFQRNQGELDGTQICPVCGKRFVPRQGAHVQRFCSQKCKDKWWNTDRTNKKKTYLITCKHCVKLFKSVDKNAKYCSLDCYWKERYGR